MGTFPVGSDYAIRDLNETPDRVIDIVVRFIHTPRACLFMKLGSKSNRVFS